MRLLFVERLRAIRADPVVQLERIGLAKGSHVADLGAGRGYYTLVAAELVGPEGLVYAVEPNPARAALIESRTAREKLANVRVLKTGAERIGAIPDSTLDIAFSFNSLHHFSDKAAAFAEVARVLRPGGTLYIKDAVKNWLSRHGTRREEASSLTRAGFSREELEFSRMTFEATYTK